MAGDSPMTVLHYTGATDDQGGIAAVIRNLAAAERFRCVLGVSAGFVRRDASGMDVLELPALATEEIGPANLLRARPVARAVQAWLRADATRVFHGHSRAGLLVGLWLHWFGERRVVVSVHCYGRQRWFYRWAARQLASRLYWLTPAMKRHYGCADRTWAGCMPDGLTAPLPAAMRRGPAEGQVLRLGGAGALVHWKRWDLVLAALARLPADSKVRFTHIGEKLATPESHACAEALRAQTAQLGLADRVQWSGWQPGSAGLLGEVDAIVVPSDREPFSMIALEAMFAGVPVIATRGGGPEDFIIDGKNGWLVPAGDAAALAQQFQQCLDPAAWRSLRLSPEHLRKFSATETLAARWAEIYAAL
ncbi:MAG: glycosyltransferase [Lacunisphaera sp.]|nr:glycosyltransferase [Lacunisphaera sp.]